MPPHIRAALICLAIAIWFWVHAKPGVLAYFQGDDMMNMHQAWDLPLPRLLTANLTPFSTVYRPAGAAFYRTLYAAAGFHPRPFRVTVYFLLAFNIWLAYRFTKLSTGSTEIAVLTALIASFHNHLRDVYLNGGAVYDVLCYTFFYGAICWYLSTRTTPSIPRTLTFLALSALALNSKEMAFTLPAVLWLYEVIYRPSSARRYGLWIVTFLAPLSFWAKTYSIGGLAENTAYAPHFSPDAFVLTTRSWLSQLFFLSSDALAAPLAILILFAPLTLALVTRRKHHLWLASLVVILPLPVNFIELRNFFVMYIPYTVWAAWAATVLIEGRDWVLLKLWKRTPLPHATWEPERIGVFVFTALALSMLFAGDSFRAFDGVDPSQPLIKELRRGLAEECRPLPAGSHILLRGDPFSREVYDPLFVARLFTHDHTVEVDRTKTVPERPLMFGPNYHCTLDYADGQFRAARN